MKNLNKALDIAFAGNINLALWGTHGVGKTQGIQQFAENKDAYLCTLILSQIDPVVLGGYPGREQQEDGSFLETFAKPEWLHNLQCQGALGKRTILFLDEFNRADRFAHNAAMNLVLDKKINGHALPNDCFIVVAMNPETEGDMGVNELTDPMIDRFAHIPVREDSKTWIAWASKNNVNQNIVDFIGKAANKLNSFELNFGDAVGNRIKATPRSWVNVSKVLDVLTDSEGVLDSKRLASEGALIISGLIGQAETASLLTHVKDNFIRPFSYEEIVGATAATVKKVKKLVKNNQTQVLITSLETFNREVVEKAAADKVRPDKVAKELFAGGFKDFLLACPADAQASFWRLENEIDNNFWSQIMAESPREVALPLAAGHE